MSLRCVQTCGKTIMARFEEIDDEIRLNVVRIKPVKPWRYFPIQPLLPDNFSVVSALENDANIKVAVFIHFVRCHTSTEKAANDSVDIIEEL